MSVGSFNDNDDAEMSLLRRAGLPECFASKRDNIDRSYRGGSDSPRHSMYHYGDIPTTKYDLMTADERTEEQARIEADVKQVQYTERELEWLTCYFLNKIFVALS